MKVYIILFAFSIAIICTVDGRPDSSIYRPRVRKIKIEQSTTIAPTSKQPIKMIPTEQIKFVEPETKPQPPLSTLFANGEKKPLMRKFIPRAKPKTVAVKVSRRPLMKPRELVIATTTLKPQPNKEDTLTPNKRKLLSPLQKSSPVADNTSKAEGEDVYDQAINDDLTPAGSIKVYRKLIGNLRKRFNVKTSKPIGGKRKYSYYIFKANDIVLEPSAMAYLRRYAEKKSYDINEEKDKNEYIFVPKPSSVTTKAVNMNLSIKPTHSHTNKAVSMENFNQQATPIVTQNVNTANTLVESTPSVEVYNMNNVAPTPSTSNKPNDDKNNLLMNSSPGLLPKANIGDLVEESSSAESKENNINNEAKDESINSNQHSTQSASTKTESVSIEAKENNLNDVSLQKTQTDAPKTDSEASPEQSTEVYKNDDRIQSNSPSSTTTRVSDSDDSAQQGTSSLQTKKGEDNSLAVGASTSQNLEGTDIM